jgi:hypothetical protein
MGFNLSCWGRGARSMGKGRKGVYLKKNDQCKSILSVRLVFLSLFHIIQHSFYIDSEVLNIIYYFRKVKPTRQPQGRGAGKQTRNSKHHSIDY